jgi:uncharacterized membrane protein
MPMYDRTFSAVQGVPMDTNRLLVGGPIAWLLLALGIRYFSAGSFLRGMLLGLVVYGVYNATNYAVLTNYNAGTAIADTLWGVFVVGAASYIVR